MKDFTNANGLRSTQTASLAAKICVLIALIFGSLQFAEAATFTVSNTNDSGAGSLRQAILDANATSGADTINFSVAGTISPASPLPTITEQVTINGYSAPGAVQNSAGTGSGFNGTLVVEIEGSMAGTSGIGLHVSAGNCTIQGLVINRFQEAGIRIDAGTGTKIYGNFIGTDLAGTTSLGNFNRGVLIVGSTLNQIGNSTPENTNVISGNFGTGISITGGGSASVARNFIGTDKNGTADLGNTQDGVRIVDSSGSTIGGANSIFRNIISGNDGSGVSIIQSSNVTSATLNVIRGNFIGVDVTGNAVTTIGGFQTSPVGNSGSGVLINAAGNTVGGNRTTTANSSNCVSACNVIAGNRANGVSISSSFATGNTVSGNNIGVGITNTPSNGTSGNSIGNRDNGVQISNLANSNIVGGTTSTAGFCNNTCNIIANNGDANSTSARAGIYVDQTALASNTIRSNSVFNNGGIGIDLGAVGSTANDPHDPDTGANNLQNFPVITSALTSGNVSGTLNSTPNTQFAIDFYSNTAADGANSEGRTYIGSTTVTTDASGNATFGLTSTTTLAAGQFVTGTATSTGGSAQAIGDTSEFSGQTLVTVAGGGFSISGTVTYGVPTNNPAKPVPNVLVTATCNNGTTNSDTTDQSGYYQIDNLIPGSTCTVTPSKSGETNGAITSFDATLVLRCVAAGNGCMLTANQRNAADTDNDGNVTSFDATLILRYVAANGANANTGQTGTWRFVPPQRTYPPLLGNQTNQNFEAILVGDVDGDWMPAAPQNRQKAEVKADK